MIHYLSKQLPNEFMDSINSFKSSSIQYDVHFVNYAPTLSKIDNKASSALGRGYLLIDKSLPHLSTDSQSESIDIVPTSTVLLKYGLLSIQKTTKLKIKPAITHKPVDDITAETHELSAEFHRQGREVKK